MTTSQPNFHSSPVPPGSEPFPEVVLTLAEAAWAAGMTREELESSIRRGELLVRRVARGGRLVSVVAMKDLERIYRAAAAEREQNDVDQQGLRERIARLEGELETSDRVERSLQRYTDRLEERTALRISELEKTLVVSRQRELVLARALGRMEGQYARLSEQIAAEVETAD